MTNPVSGAWYLLRGLRLLLKPGVRAFVILPLLLNMAIFTGAIVAGMSYFDALLEQLQPALPDWLSWLRWLFWLLFLLATLLIAFFTFSLVANIVSAPFNGLLAEAVEAYLSGRRPQNAGGWRKAFKEFLPGVVAEIRKSGYLFLRYLLCLALFLIPGVQIAAPFILMLYSAWALAMEYMDYPMSNHGLHFPENRRQLAQRRLQSLGFGGAVMAATLVPVANFLVMPAAVAGATALWLEKYQTP